MGTEEFIQLMKVKQGNRSLRQFATSIGVSAAYVSDIYLRRRLPGAKVANALGYACSKTYAVTVLFTRQKVSR